MEDETEAQPGPEGSADAEIDAAQEKRRQKVNEGVGKDAPQFSQPVPAEEVNALGEAIKATISALTGGDIEAPIAPVEGEAVESVPPDIYTGLVALSKLVEKAKADGVDSADQYEFDPAMVADENGLGHLTSLVGLMAKDRALIADMKRPMKPAKAKEPEKEAAAEAPPPSKEDRLKSIS